MRERVTGLEGKCVSVPEPALTDSTQKGDLSSQETQHWAGKFRGAFHPAKSEVASQRRPDYTFTVLLCVI